LSKKKARASSFVYGMITFNELSYAFLIINVLVGVLIDSFNKLAEILFPDEWNKVCVAFIISEEENVFIIVLILFRLDLSQQLSKYFAGLPIVLFCSCVGSWSSHFL